MVTNQVRPQSHDESCLYPFQGMTCTHIKKFPPNQLTQWRLFCAVQKMDRILKDRTRYYSHIVAVPGFHWAHAVTIRLVLEAKSGS